tara:strand:- start:1351 stop:1620 length:270 start_codon:yes stop_codon:yes gene_type:complete
MFQSSLDGISGYFKRNHGLILIILVIESDFTAHKSTFGFSTLQIFKHLSGDIGVLVLSATDPRKVRNIVIKCEVEFTRGCIISDESHVS